MKVLFKNSSLEFRRKHTKQIVYKDYWVRASGQGVNLDSLGGVLDSISFNNLKGILNAYFIDMTGSTDAIFQTRGSNASLNIPASKSLRFAPFSDGYVDFDAFTQSGAFEVSFNTATQSATMGGVTKTASATPSSSTIQFCGIYMGASKTSVTPYIGKTKFGRLRLYKANDDTLLCDVRPAVVDGVPCLYDAVSDTEFYSVDGTALVLE